MEEVLVVIVQVFFEFVIQVFASGLLDVAAAPLSRRTQDGCGVFLLHALFGGGLGWLSTLLVPKLLLPYFALRLLNLALAPLLAGAASYWIATQFRESKLPPAEGTAEGPADDGMGHFWHGFLFALMFGLSRFAAATH